ncbi:V-type ATP synthase subunit C [Tissierella sp. Yu-01]|uniref:V-type ATP synthase subunit C n=1 Tax=Tissierella sp. Yu-01 TaxID=3035694 RepID=UPI00240E0AAB|nr:V-type ATP synthase subunit C [Tissierella sp. Yu-01]WFA08461.1 V-type ATP synthase subunit C [Tissierella sp. Yu-01]
MDRMDFVQGVTRTRVLETRLLSRTRIDRMIEARDIDEVLKVLNETEYSNSLAGITRGEEYEKVLSNELNRVYELMREITKDQIVVDILALKYDYHNLKVMIKEKEANKDLSDLYVSLGTTDYKDIKSEFLHGNLNGIKPEFKDAIEAVLKDLEETKDPQRIDIIMDRYYYEHLYNMAKETKIDLFINYVKDMIDFINIKSSIRLKKQGKDIRFFEDVILPNGNIDKETILFTLNDNIDNMILKFKNSKISSGLIKGLESYKETNRLTDLEKYMDDYLMELNKPSKYIHFGPEPIFSYIVAKETEIKTLRIIMVSKLNNLSPDVIRERVRDLYV